VGDQPVRSVRTPEYDALLRLLKELRTESGITQKELCIRLGQEITYVSKLERGTWRMDLIEFFEFARALELDPVSIIQRFQLGLSTKSK